MDGSCVARGSWVSGVWSVAAMYSAQVCGLDAARHDEFRVDLAPINGARFEEALRSERGGRILLSVSLPSSRRAGGAPVSRRTLPSGRSVRGGVAVSAGHGPVVFSGFEQGPDGAGHAPGEGTCHQFHRLALQHVPQPICSGRLVAAR